MCPDFGMCIGDASEAHCRRCGNLYFRGNSGFPYRCSRQDPDDFDRFNYESDEDEDPFLESEDVVYDMLPEANTWDGLLKDTTLEY
jgi:hypothetical protein